MMMKAPQSTRSSPGTSEGAEEQTRVERGVDADHQNAGDRYEHALVSAQEVPGHEHRDVVEVQERHLVASHEYRERGGEHEHEHDRATRNGAV